MMSPFLQPAKLIIEILSMTRVLVNIPLSSDIYISITPMSHVVMNCMKKEKNLAS